MPITTEDLVSSLLSIGYDKVDSVLFTSAKNIITEDTIFKFEDYSINKIFNSPITFNGTFFKLREGLSLNSSVNTIKDSITIIIFNLNFTLNILLFL